MSIRLCLKCKEQCDKGKGGLLQMVLKVAKNGNWICPFGKSQCGKEVK